MATTVNGSPQKLALWRTVRQAYRVVFSHFDVLVRIAWPWLLIMLPLHVAYYWQVYSTMVAPGIDPQVPPTFVDESLNNHLWWLVMTLPWSAIALGWHRFLLRGEPPPARFAFQLEQPFFAYVGIALLFGAMTSAPILLANLAPAPGDEEVPVVFLVATAVFVVAMLVTSRLSVALPAIAVGGPGRDFGDAWRRTRGNTWRLLMGSLLTGFPLIAFALVELAIAQFTGRHVFAIAGAVLGSMNLLLIAVGVGFLSFAWRHFYEPELSLPSAT